MTESALLLREAFNESVNYMTWSFLFTDNCLRFDGFFMIELRLRPE